MGRWHRGDPTQTAMLFENIVEERPASVRAIGAGDVRGAVEGAEVPVGRLPIPGRELVREGLRPHAVDGHCEVAVGDGGVAASAPSQDLLPANPWAKQARSTRMEVFMRHL